VGESGRARLSDEVLESHVFSYLEPFDVRVDFSQLFV
jgi:hypothetical protein